MADDTRKSKQGEKTDAGQTRNAHDGLAVERTFTTADEKPFEQITWEKRSARIADDKGEAIFEQNDVEVPADWSQTATKVVVSKYFFGQAGSGQRENSVRQLVNRVSRTIADWGKADGLFASDADAETFYDELTWLCVNQYGAFNSPVWFNVGLFHQNGVSSGESGYHWDAKKDKPAATDNAYEYPQASACFIQGVEDDMQDIMRLAAQEAQLFKHGSGTGTDLSTLRSSREKLAGGGTPSGPLSFMRVYDQVAGVVKSGGKTRRAAKMQSLRCDHPDIKEFIEAKGIEEKKAWALIEQGYDGSFNGEAYASVMYQNANFSIRVTDDFMQAAMDDQDWQTYNITDGKPSVKYRAQELLRKIAEGTHVCGDPGVQYHTTVNKWHTCPESGEIRASNPCSEYMFLDDSACNLASLNLMKFRKSDGSMEIDRLRSAIRIFTIAQEILVDHASYPSEKICRNSHDYRPLGLGYANLGALVMSLGLAYDSDGGRAVAGAITSILTGTSYATSAEIASRVGTFPQFYKNRQSMLHVVGMHRSAVAEIDESLCTEGLHRAAEAAWDEAYAAGEQFGYRNAQVSVLAPTGTIGFMMDCDTTGIEPDIALVKYKQLAGGGMFKIVNQTVPLALQRLGYSQDHVSEIMEHIDEHDTIEGAPGLAEEHLCVFDCAFRPANGSRSIHYMGHIRMMAAVQPFISGAISKTVNMPNEATVDEIMQVYMDGWKTGLKAIAIYRDGSKRIQPLNTKNVQAKKKLEEFSGISQADLEAAKRAPHRERLPATRPSITHKFDVAGHEGYITVGLYEDGMPGEVFIAMAKEGSTVGGMMDAFATAISLCLQYGVPLESLITKFTHQRFEPSGMTSNRNIPFAKSIVDYIFRWLNQTFLNKDDAPDRNQAKKNHAIPPAAQKPLELASRTKLIKAAPEAIRDDKKTSENRVEQSPSTDAGAAGALLGGYLPADDGEGGLATKTAVAVATNNRLLPKQFERVDMQFSHFQQDAPPCPTCGSITVRNGNCYKCHNCGSSLGCS